MEPATNARSLIDAVPARVAAHYPLLPLGWADGVLRVAMSEPPDVRVKDELRVLLGAAVAVETRPREDIERGLKDLYGIGAATLESLTRGSPAILPDAAVAHNIERGPDASVVKLVNQILLEAYAARATDVHLEPYGDDLRVRYRIDGVLYDAKFAGSLQSLAAAVVSRVKIMADLSIAEKRLPQDGRFKVTFGGKQLDLRVSTLPTPFGEAVVVRLLSEEHHLDLAGLGFFGPDLSTLSSFLERPHGVLFLTGPTGSGKTTSLYAFLNRLNTPERKIITLEDPIEYQLRGITQVQMNPRVGLTFAAGLRSLLRHDPDVMMVGEVRDLETAEIAIRVSLTGHRVFSTLHTNDAPSAITRLLDLGLEPYLVASSITGIVAQRLVRLVCGECRREATITPLIERHFGALIVGEKRFFEGAGCKACNGSGYRGRTVIYELLPVTEALRALVMERAPAGKIREAARAGGMKTLRQCGWEKIAAGQTTPSEVIRVTEREEGR